MTASRFRALVSRPRVSRRSFREIARVLHESTMSYRTLFAVTSLSDLNTWIRGNGLEIVLLVSGAILLTRFATWFGSKITERIDARDHDTDALVRSEAAKHRHSVTQVVTWTAL